MKKYGPRVGRGCTDRPSACSFRSCSQLANSWSRLLLQHLARLGLRCALPPPPAAQAACRLRLLINSLEAALTAALGAALLSAAQGLSPRHLPQWHLEPLVNNVSSTPTYVRVTHRAFSFMCEKKIIENITLFLRTYLNALVFTLS